MLGAARAGFLGDSGIGGAAYRDLIVSDGPAAYYRLAETSGTKASDEMGGGDGDYINTPTLGQSSLLASGDGKSMRTTAASGAPPSTAAERIQAWSGAAEFYDNVTVEFWYQWDTGIGASETVGTQFAAKYDSFGGYGQTWIVLMQGGQLTFACHVFPASGGPWWYGRMSVANSADIWDGNPHHIAATYETAAREVKIYKDGVVGATVGVPSVTKNLSASAGTFAVAGSSTAGSSAVRGWYQEFALYNKVLSQPTIQTHYNAGI